MGYVQMRRLYKELEPLDFSVCGAGPGATLALTVDGVFSLHLGLV